MMRVHLLRKGKQYLWFLFAAHSANDVFIFKMSRKTPEVLVEILETCVIFLAQDKGKGKIFHTRCLACIFWEYIWCHEL